MRNEALYSLAAGLIEKGYRRKEVKGYLQKHKFSAEEIESTLNDLDKKYERHLKLVSYIKKQKRKGHPYESIRHHLMKHGISHEEAHKAIGHAIAAPKGEGNVMIVLGIVSIILGLAFIFPFLPPIGLVLAIAVLMKSANDKTRLIAKIGIVLSLISIIIGIYLFVSYGNRTGAAAKALASQDTITLFPSQTKKVFIFIENDKKTKETFTVDSFKCATECPDISFGYDSKGTLNPQGYYSLPIRVSASDQAVESAYSIEYSIIAAGNIVRGKLPVLIVPPQD